MKIFVFGGDHHNTIGVIRCIAEVNSKIEIFAIVKAKRENSITVKCRYTTKVYTVATQQEGLDILLKKRSDDEKHILICCSDGSAEIIDRHLNELLPYYYLQNAKEKAGRIIHYMNKGNISDLAERCGFTIPVSHVMNVEDEIPIDLSYPCLTKPLVPIGGHKSDIITCQDKAALEKALSTIRKDGCTDLQIQQYIDKEYELSIVGCSLNGGENLVLPGIIRKIREYPIKRGSSSFAVMLPWSYYKFNLEPVHKIMLELGYTGLFSIEFLRSKGNDYFLEVNLRNDGNGAVSTAGGINLPDILIKSFLGKDYNLENRNIECPIYFMRDEFDYVHVLEHRLSLLEWIKDFQRINFFLLYDKKDKGPFNKRRMSIVKNVVKHIIGWRK